MTNNPHHLITYSHGHCPFGSFRCDSKLCIPSQRLCDGLPHCPDGEDESDKQCPESSRKMRRVMSRRQSTEPIDLSDCHCENGGTCLKDENVSSHDDQTLSSRVATKCLCTEEFSGDRCELMGVAKRHHLAAVIARCTCKNGGTCTPTSSGFGFVCSCAPGFRGYDCSHNDSIPNASSPTEYGIAMGAAVVAVLLVMFGVALCICVILQYLRQQREGPESPYSRTLSRDVYSVEGVDIAGLQMESVEPNDYIPPSYNQCMHPSPSSPEGDVFLTPSQSSQFSIGSRWRVRTPESPPPTYDAILGFCKECSELALRNMALKQQRTPSSDRFDTMSGASSYNYTTGPGSNYTTGSNTPVGQLPVSPRGMYGSGVAGGGVGVSVGVGIGTPSGVASAGGALVIRGTSTQSQTDSPLEEFELRRVQST
ncbi:uncharacterized protein [Diadema setosum]|uniref:uncharacterized protein n=1 Tax=Diadema setosum TaxID=31175 RepID=UPI003B3B17DE